jgi:hypothetical protein
MVPSPGDLSPPAHRTGAGSWISEDDAAQGSRRPAPEEVTFGPVSGRLGQESVAGMDLQTIFPQAVDPAHGHHAGADLISGCGRAPDRC